MKKIAILIGFLVCFIGLKAQSTRFDSFPDITTLADEDEFILWQNSGAAVKNISWGDFQTNISSSTGAVTVGTGYIYGGTFAANYASSLSGKKIVAFGDQTILGYNSSGEVTALGYYTMQGTTTATNAIAIGTYSLQSAAGSSVIGIGKYSLASNTGAGNVIGIGENACRSNSGTIISGLGWSVARNNTGSNVSFMGYRSGYSNTGTNVIGIGYDALYSNTGNNSYALGYRGLYYNTAVNNIAIGFDVLYSDAAENLKGANNVALGAEITYGDTNITNTFTVSFQDTISQPNTVYFDSTFTYFGIGTAAPTEKLHVNGNIKGEGNLIVNDTIKTNDILDRTGNGIQLLSDLGFFVANEAASQYFIAVDGTGAEVEINSTLMDVNAGVEVSGTAEFSGNIYQTNSATPSPTIAVSGLTISDYTYQVASATSYSFKITGSYSGSAADSAYIDITVPDDGQLKFNGNLDGIWMTTGGGVTAGDRFGIVDYAYSYKNAGGTGSWIVASNDLRNSWGDSDQLTFVFATLGGSRANIYLHEGSLSGTQGYECTFTMEFMIIDSDY